MIKISDFETPKAAKRRRRQEGIVKDYLSCASYIRIGKVTPHAVFTLLARNNNMTRQGVQALLRREGIYGGADEPVIIPEHYKVQPKQLSMPFFLDASSQHTSGL